MYRFDPFDSSVVIDGFENGIAPSMHAGISDLKNVNIVSIPGEASVMFGTKKISSGTIAAGNVISADAGTKYVTYTGAANLESGMGVTFSAQSSLGVTADSSTPYWIYNLNGAGPGTFQLTSDYTQTNVVSVTNGTGTFTVNTMDQPQYFVDTSGPFNINQFFGFVFMSDSKGQVWSNYLMTGRNRYWTWTGNRVPNQSYTAGKGLVYYQPTGKSSGDGYLFLFHNGSIDYAPTGGPIGNISWVYGWVPTTGANEGWKTTPTQRLNNNTSTNNSHEALVGQDNAVYFCDETYVSSFYEKPLKTFDPADATTYIWNGYGASSRIVYVKGVQTTIPGAGYALNLPKTDVANCLSELGVNLLVGGLRNFIYPWDRVSTSFTYPILISENIISKMITVNTNTYIFAGARGRIYITNGTQAQLYKKIPDHISGTIEPYFIWGGVAFNKNQLYFSAKAVSNSGYTYISGYGGLWAIDTDSGALRLVNQLSYGTYYGYATAIGALKGSNINYGTGLVIGWDDGSSGYGIDGSLSTPYTGLDGRSAIIETDLIPIGTFQKPRSFQILEYKLTKPLVGGESIEIQYRTDFSQSYTSIFTDSTIGHFSSMSPVNFGNAQWLQFKIILNSTVNVNTPSFTRLREIRVTGLVQ